MVSGLAPEVAEIVADCALVRKVGEGATAEVWEARGPSGETVALKLLRPECAEDAEILGEFRNEAEATAAIHHENVVRVEGCGYLNGRHFIRMELVDGPCLADLLIRRGKLPVRGVLLVSIQVARALAYAHGMGFVHRDVKPDNVLLYRDGRARLTDFGIVKDVSSLKGYLLPGRKVGTPAYASPEQCLGKRLSTATDVYSLGATLYHMLTGAPPFTGGTRSEIMRRHVRETPVSVSEVSPEVPKTLSKLVDRMMSKKVVDRPESMERVVQDLEMIRAGKIPIIAPRRRP